VRLRARAKLRELRAEVRAAVASGVVSPIEAAVIVREELEKLNGRRK
jgi:hypothetical protein